MSAAVRVRRVRVPADHIGLGFGQPVFGDLALRIAANRNHRSFAGVGYSAALASIASPCWTSRLPNMKVCRRSR
jgi:hypothetical protein